MHNFHLINLAYIKKYHKGKGGSILMSDHSEVEISLRRKEGLLKMLQTERGYTCFLML
jgi:two-component system LytT family response regulator